MSDTKVMELAEKHAGKIKAGGITGFLGVIVVYVAEFYSTITTSLNTFNERTERITKEVVALKEVTAEMRDDMGQLRLMVERIDGKRVTEIRLLQAEVERLIERVKELESTRK